MTREQKNNYTLGASKAEQKRLADQQLLYEDAHFLMFNKNDSVCEIGSGSGANLWIANKVRKFTCVDIQKKQVEESRRKAKLLSLTNAEFHHADGCNLSLEKNTFDATFCRLVLIHLRDPMPMIQEMLRITRLGGKIVAIEPDVVNYDSSTFLDEMF